MGARVVRRSDFRVMMMPVAVWPPEPEEEAREESKVQGPRSKVTEEYFMGQVSAVVSLSRTSKLNYRSAVKQIEKIVQNYERKNR